MDPALFLADLERIPETLDGYVADWPVSATSPRRVVLAGMGSSWFAARDAAGDLRRLGIDAVAERASSAGGWPPADDTLVVAISASGASVETLDFLARHSGRSATIALTNTIDSTMADRCDDVVELAAAAEPGGVACRSFHHTVAALLSLAARWGAPWVPADVARRAAAAIADLLDRRGDWLDEAADVLAGPQGTWIIAPEERMASALQGALMLREGPRRVADGCETGDWSHVDVYLTKTCDYRALVLPGSRWDEAAAQWMTRRGSTVLAVGGPFSAASSTLRYPGDDDPLVARLVEVVVPSLVGARWWSATRGGGG